MSAASGALGALGTGLGRGAARGAPSDSGAGSGDAVLAPAAPPSEERSPAAENHRKVQIHLCSQERECASACPMPVVAVVQ